MKFTVAQQVEYLELKIDQITQLGQAEADRARAEGIPYNSMKEAQKRLILKRKLRAQIAALKLEES